MDIQRLTTLPVGQKKLPLPLYFPSISSVKTTLQPIEYLQVLSSLASYNRQFLVSAFDLAVIDTPETIRHLLKTANESGAVTLMDSGNYESFWKEAQDDWKQDSYHKVLQAFPCNLAFTFDEQKPPGDNDEHLALVVSRWQENQSAAGDCVIVPIIHRHRSAVELPVLCARVAEATGVSMVAVAERELGDGIIARAHSVKAIRYELNKQSRYVALHLLGTGNPISLALYATLGADSFDGLEWCQTVVDHNTALLFHLSQADFFAGQSESDKANLSFHPRTLAHNLEFYANWMQQLHKAILDDKTVEFCRTKIPDHIFRQCALAFGWE